MLAATYAFARRSNTLLAVSFLIAAALIKLPFVLIGGVLLTPLAGVNRRLFAWTFAVAIALILSYLIPGPAYISGLSQFAHQRVSDDSDARWIGAIALLLGGMLVASRRGVFGAAWLFQQLPVLAAPWYLYWGLPYALATGVIEIYVVALPAFSAILDEAATDIVWQSFVVFFVFVAATDVYISRRFRQGTTLKSFP